MNASSVGVAQFAIITGKGTYAKTALEKVCASITSENPDALSAREVKYANMAGKSQCADSAMET